MVLTAAELAELRDDLADHLPDTCVVTRVTRVRNDSGGWTETTVDADPIACRFSAAGQPGIATIREVLVGGRLAVEADGVFSMPYDADVRQSDRVTHDGTTYEVSGVPVRSEHLVKRVFVKAVT